MEVKFTVDKSGGIYYTSSPGRIFWRGYNSLGFMNGGTVVCKTCIHDDELYILLSTSSNIVCGMTHGVMLTIDISLSVSRISDEMRTMVFKFDGSVVTNDVIYYSLLIKINGEPEKCIFHPPNLNIEQCYRLRWFKSQVKMKTGNGLAMCHSNHDLIIKYL